MREEAVVDCFKDIFLEGLKKPPLPSIVVPDEISKSHPQKVS
jgi:hypothetical protein